MALSEAIASEDGLRAEAIEMRVSRPGMPNRRLRLVADRATFGSSTEATVRLDDPSVAGIHAILERSQGQLVVRARRGLVLVGNQSVPETSLLAGTSFTLGAYTFEVLAAPHRQEHGRSADQWRPANHGNQAGENGLRQGTTAAADAPVPFAREPHSSAGSEHEGLQQRVMRLELQLADRARQSQQLESLVEELRAIIDRQQNEADQKRRASEQIEQVNLQLDEELEQLRRVVEQEQSRTAVFDVERQTLATALAEHRERLTDVRQQLDQQTQDLAAAREALSQAEAGQHAMRSELQSLRDNLLEAFRRNETLSIEHEGLRHELESAQLERDTWHNERDKWQHERSQVETALEELRCQLLSEQTAHQQCLASAEESERSATALREELSQLKQHHLALSETYEQRVQEQREQIVVLADRWQSDKNQCETSEHARRSLEVELAQVCHSLAAATEELQELRSNRQNADDLQSRLDVLERELPNSRLVAQREIDRLRDRLADQESQLEAARLANEDSNRACVDAEYRAQRLRDRLQETERELATAATALQTTHEQARASGQQVEHQGAEIETLRAELRELRASSRLMDRPMPTANELAAEPSLHTTPRMQRMVADGSDGSQRSMIGSSTTARPSHESGVKSSIVGVTETHSHGDSHDSIEAYMRQLLDRVAGKPAEVAAIVATDAPPPMAAPVVVAEPAIRLSVQPIPAPPLAAAPDIHLDRAGLRALASENIESALKASHARRKSEESITKFAIAGLGMVGFMGLMFVNGFRMGYGLIAAVCCLVIAAIWSFDAWIGLPRTADVAMAETAGAVGNEATGRNEATGE